MSLTPTSFVPPTEWRSPSFQLRVLSPRYAQQDFDAVSQSAAQIRHVFGPANDWPPERFSFVENLADLTRHENEFHQRKAFAYAMLDLSEHQYLGCVYIKPLKSKIEPDFRKAQFQAQTFFWLSSSQCQVTAAQTLVALKRWLEHAWPFQAVAFPGREIEWQSWERMAHAEQRPTPPAIEPSSGRVPDRNQN